jgi:hypothetical protein
MERTYHAIYRTEDELMPVVQSTPYLTGSTMDSEDVYVDAHPNNRAGTRQRWFLFERSR